MKVISFLSNSMISLHSSLKRFPIALALTTIATFLLIIITHFEQDFSKATTDLLVRMNMAFALGIPITLCTKLIFERKDNIQAIIKIIIYTAEVFGVFAYFLLGIRDVEMVSITRYIGLSLSFYVAFTFIPYFYKRNEFEEYVIKLSIRVIVTSIYSAVLFLGVAAILLTIDKLLGINIPTRIYLDIFIGILGIFAPCFFLSGIPLLTDEFDVKYYPSPLKVLLSYIVMPIITIYTVILYIYFVKNIITLQWPNGLVAHLVLWYSVICVLIIFLSSPLQDQSKWVRTFKFLLLKFIIPLIIMMFVSMGIRVKAYGITENRYFVILLGLWVLGIMCYLNFARIKRNIVIAVSISIISFLSVVGPWSSYAISSYSQNQRLEKILLRYNMINENRVVKSDKEVADVDKKEISQILSYFSHNNKMDDVKTLPKGFNMNQMKDVLGFPNSEYMYSYEDKKSFSYDYDFSGNVIDIKGYSYMFSIRSYGSSTPNSENDLNIKYDEKNEIKITYKDIEVYKSNMLEFAKQLFKKYGTGMKNSEIKPNDMFFIDENNKVKVKFIFKNVYGDENQTNHEIDLHTLNFDVLIELK